ncbi:hypothetical protein [Nocardia amamiensis]|uniref:hypothetical protein n=1 Tax=Nocardia amamiensis TaxID=404578 RepID=UPI00082DCC95|nr:hypothetical protein [Nocardia amamiensis]
MNRDTLLTPPEVCGHADLRLAHAQMQAHRACRVQRCAWKAAAHHTLVAAGRLTPQTLSPRERAAARGIPFPPADQLGPSDPRPAARTLHEVLERLSELAAPPEPLWG